MFLQNIKNVLHVCITFNMSVLYYVSVFVEIVEILIHKTQIMVQACEI